MRRPSQSDPLSLWLPLLRALTDSSNTWGVLKNVDRALAGFGDIDSIAPEEQWAQLRQCHQEWARSNDAIATIACTHFPNLLILLAVIPDRDALLQLDVFSSCYWRGSEMFTAMEIAPLMVTDPRGFRRLRPGAEGVVLLLLNGVRWGARPDADALRRKGVRDLLRRDPDGVAAVAQLIGGRQDILRAVSRIHRGQWPTISFLMLEARSIARSLRDPRSLAARLTWRSGAHSRACPVDQALRDGRRVPADLEAWFRSITSLGHGHTLTRL